ncbi:alanine racemase [Thiohalobacter sp. IOR34]|uniref:alanine racemase n=1 Tax=Thiohalobacter sp. IOR34 TaxID=3057176 RepID=UPI0025B08E28|nr:alanine racemase [Thiohalobacter sp. IOR34]WJW74786.1 alanine racemase [Thiohalobacter sp. IOR34]
MARPACVQVDTAALRHNLQIARRHAPHSQLLAVVKANGYGHGLQQVARSLSAADALGVASLEEALTLREAGIRQPITLLEGFFEADELDAICEQQLSPVIHQPQQLEILEASRLRAPLHVWLKIDSGMHRLGFPPQAAQEAWQRLNALPQICRVRLMSHLACADEPDGEVTRHQLQHFLSATEGMEAERSLANSAALLAWPQTRLDWVRPGLMLYGISPFAEGCGADLGLQPAMTFSTRLIAVRRLRRGDAVGYGGDWVCPEDMPVGIAAAGYGDGYPRHAPSGTPLLVNGRRAQLIGRVSMDMLCIDLRDQPRAAVGDPVTLWGQGLPVETVARAAATIPYELCCRVAPRRAPACT